jgi:hypothetical protein
LAGGFIRLLLLIVILGASPLFAQVKSTRPKLSDPVPAEEIPALISDLAHASFEQRTYATRRLCAAGMKARDALRKAATGSNIEAALRAQMILTALDNLLFAGVSIELTPTRTEFAWDEPVDLAVTFTNQSEFAAHVPFELDPSRRSRDESEARQVADMLDLAEWLVVTDENGRPVSLRVDDMDVDRDIRAAVYNRVEGAPVSALEAGKRATLTIRGFNRGWARYPLLDRGRYRITFDYVPPWEDEALAAAKVGRATGNTVDVNVTTSAPDAVSRGGAEALVELVREDDRYVVRLTNRRDQAVHVNKSFGAVTPFAQGRWVRERGDMVREIPVIPQDESDRAAFEVSGLVEVPPGGSLEIASLPVEELKRRFEQMGIAGSGGFLYFSYSNLLNRPWQARQGIQMIGDASAPNVLRETLPRRILTGWHTSNRLREATEP